MHGPGAESYLNWFPTWPGRDVPVLDTIAQTLRPRRAAKWREARKVGLALWSATADIDFYTMEALPEEYPQIDYTRFSEPGYLDTLIVPGYLHLLRATPEARPEAFAWWAAAKDPGALAAFKVSKLFWARTPGARATVICHEVGHCLGLAHRPAGWGPVSGGVMGTGNHPDQHDIDSVMGWDYH